MVSDVLVVRFSIDDWFRRIRFCLEDDATDKGMSCDKFWESIGALKVEFTGALSRCVRLTFRTPVQAMWFSLKYLGD